MATQPTSSINKTNKVSNAMHILCPCGTEMKRMQAGKIYQIQVLQVTCDNCSKAIPDDVEIYSCPRQRCWQHLSGYDICDECAMKQLQNKTKPKLNNESKNNKNSKNKNTNKNNVNNKTANARKFQNNGISVRNKEKFTVVNDTGGNIDEQDMQLLKRLSPAMKSILMSNIGEFIFKNNGSSSNSNERKDNDNYNDEKLDSNKDQNTNDNLLTIMDSLNSMTVIQMATLNQLMYIYGRDDNYK